MGKQALSCQRLIEGPANEVPGATNQILYHLLSPLNVLKKRNI